MMVEMKHRDGQRSTMLVTGGTCPVGECFLRKIAAAGHFRIVCLVRPERDASSLRDLPIEFIHCDLDRDPLSPEWLRDVDLVVHVAGIRRVIPVLEAMERSGVGTGLFVNTAAVHSRFSVASQEYRCLEDRMIEYCERTGIRYAAIRPTMIYGDGRNRNVSLLVRHLSRHSFFPLFGSGEALVQPVFYQDVAGALVSLLAYPEVWGRFYDTGGKASFSYRRFVEAVGAVLGKKVRFVRLPVQAGITLARLGERMGRLVPWTEEQVLRSTEDRVTDNTPAREAFGYDPRGFWEGLEAEITALRSRGVLQ
ncbi:MAG TPA: NAD(P)-dependent oxidoreductase [Atribacteraceae bacterium]|nr:NAD(P)-dependent oxidoreductase [Atribacteraceae bacterium]